MSSKRQDRDEAPKPPRIGSRSDFSQRIRGIAVPPIQSRQELLPQSYEV
jgi:hypothetical protein